MAEMAAIMRQRQGELVELDIAETGRARFLAESLFVSTERSTTGRTWLNASCRHSRSASPNHLLSPPARSDKEWCNGVRTAWPPSSLHSMRPSSSA